MRFLLWALAVLLWMGPAHAQTSRRNYRAKVGPAKKARANKRTQRARPPRFQRTRSTRLRDALRAHGAMRISSSNVRGARHLNAFARGKKIGSASTRYDRAARLLEFHVDVSPGSRRQGVASALFRRALTQHPLATHAPVLAANQNLEVFLRSGFNRPWRGLGFEADDIVEMSPKESAEFRRAVVRGVAAMPAIRMRAANGFARIEKIVVNPDAPRIAVDVRRGPPRPNSEIKVVVESGFYAPFKVTAAGAHKPGRSVIHRRWDDDNFRSVVNYQR